MSSRQFSRRSAPRTASKNLRRRLKRKRSSSRGLMELNSLVDRSSIRAKGRISAALIRFRRVNDCISLPAGWKIGDKTGRSGKGATNDIAILRPSSGGPVFIAIYTVDTGGPEEGRQKLIADVAKAALDALRK